VAVLVLWSVLELAAVRGRSDRAAVLAEASVPAVASGLALLVAAWLAIGAPAAGARGQGFGVPLALAGIAVRLLAIRALGRGFTSAIIPSGPLVDRGIYAHLPQPSDAGLLLLAIG